MKTILDWRFCNVRPGMKKPYPDNWQDNPLEINKITSSNYGVILGKHSNGLMAIDFDGPSAWDWWNVNINRPIVDTIGWTSGKDGRAQFAYFVDEEYWPYLHTKRIPTGTIGADGKAEMIEFRWTGAQSVLPPSINPDTHKPYVWIGSSEIAILDDVVLMYWLNISNPVTAPAKEYKPVGNDEVIEVMGDVKAKYPRVSYSEWASIAWAVAHEVGVSNAEVIMKGFYPEMKPGEYKNLYRKYNKEKSPTMGTLKHIAYGAK